jgi:hypothetical protein
VSTVHHTVAICIAAAIALRIAIYSKSSVNLLVPIVLVATAGAMCSAQLFRAKTA